jgi:hypothetical protein
LFCGFCLEEWLEDIMRFGCNKVIKNPNIIRVDLFFEFIVKALLKTFNLSLGLPKSNKITDKKQTKKKERLSFVSVWSLFCLSLVCA